MPRRPNSYRSSAYRTSTDESLLPFPGVDQNPGGTGEVVRFRLPVRQGQSRRESLDHIKAGLGLKIARAILRKTNSIVVPLASDLANYVEETHPATAYILVQVAEKSQLSAFRNPSVKIALPPQGSRVCLGKKLYASEQKLISIAPGFSIPVRSLGFAAGKGEDLEGMNLVEIQTSRRLLKWTDEKMYWYLCPRRPDWYAAALNCEAYPLESRIRNGFLAALDVAFYWLASDCKSVEHVCINIDEFDGRTLILGYSRLPLDWLRCTDQGLLDAILYARFDSNCSLAQSVRN